MNLYKTNIFSLCLIALFASSAMNVQAMQVKKYTDSFTIANARWTAVAVTTGSIIAYYSWLKMQAPTLTPKSIESWYDYFVNAQLRLDHPNEYDIIRDENNKAKQMKNVIYPAHGIGVYISYMEELVERCWPVVVLPLACIKAVDELKRVVAFPAIV